MASDSYVYRERKGSSAGAPLLLLLHGTGGDENQFFDLGNQLLPGAQLIGVRGDVSERGMLRYFRRTGEGVYDMEDLAARTDKMAAFIAEKREEGMAAAVYGLGYSNGANILASVLFKRPDLLDGAVLLHPLIPFTPAPQPGLGGKRVLVTAGRRDPIAPAALTETLVNWLSEQGAAVETLWHAGGHELSRDELGAARAFLEGTTALRAG
ncbi:MAG TPA: alpha/beta hydrolase [Devosia sp.]|nr:alpha/beta hydrolase [Devosia sp.]